MKNLLFPRIFQPIGWIMFLPSLIMGVLVFLGVFSLRGTAETVVNDIVIIGIALGSLFIVCSKERIEDEMTRSIRLSSLLTSIYVYVALLVLCTLFINGINFSVFLVINLVLFPLIFVCIFRLEIYRFNRLNEDE